MLLIGEKFPVLSVLTCLSLPVWVNTQTYLNYLKPFTENYILSNGLGVFCQKWQCQLPALSMPNFTMF